MRLPIRALIAALQTAVATLQAAAAPAGPTWLGLPFLFIEQFSLPSDTADDDGPLLQRACEAARSQKKKLYITRDLHIATKALVAPVPGQSEYTLTIESAGSVLYYTGPAGTVAEPAIMLQELGARNGSMKGLTFALASNQANVVLHDIDTRDSLGGRTIASVSGNTYERLTYVISKGVNAKCVRLGHVAGGGGDISTNCWNQCNFVANEYVNGVAPTWQTCIAGQHALSVESSNALANGMLNCNFFYLYNPLTFRDGEGGNGSFVVQGGDFTGCALCADYANNQPFAMRDVRFEVCGQIFRCPDGTDSPNLTFENLRIDQCDGAPGSGCLFEINRPAISLFVNVQARKIGSPYTERCLMFQSFSSGPATPETQYDMAGDPRRKGNVEVRSCGFYTSTDKFHYLQTDAQNGPRFTATLSNNKRLNSNGDIVGDYANTAYS